MQTQDELKGHLDVLLEELKEVIREGNVLGFPAGIIATVTQISEGKLDENIHTFGFDTHFFQLQCSLKEIL